ncbi:MAG TPA: NAD(P)-dependent oxidoreductase [Bacteroidia bacterium]|nr:NAD(P)-dependent oxidoreductase [Bacteroidia bacterium]
MKILVTGATGFLGNYVVNDFLENGIDVIATSRSESKAKTFKWFDKVEYVPYNINDSQKPDDNLFQYFRSPDKLIHLAWENLPNYTELFHIEKNLFPNYYFLKRMIDGGLKDITVTGTCFEYGMQNGCLSESIPSGPKNSYAIAKDILRRLVNVLNAKEPFSFKWIRLFYIYGKGQSDKSLFTQMEKAIEHDEKEFRMSGGEQVRDFLPAEDVATIIRKITLSNSNLGIVNCCSGKPQTIKSFVEKYFFEKKKNIKLILGYYPYPDYEPMEFWGDATKLNTIIKQFKTGNPL